MNYNSLSFNHNVAQSIEAAEYADCISAEQKTPPYTCPIYDIKQSFGELKEMRRTFFLPVLLGPLWTGVVAPDRVQSMCQIEINYVLMLN